MTPVATTQRAPLGSISQTVSDRRADDELLEWPPDVFLLTNILLEQRHVRQAKQQATPRNERLPTTAS
jgi:hypothetical protein